MKLLVHLVKAYLRDSSVCQQPAIWKGSTTKGRRRAYRLHLRQKRHPVDPDFKNRLTKKPGKDMGRLVSWQRKLYSFA
jgi:hypothetical protein